MRCHKLLLVSFGLILAIAATILFASPSAAGMLHDNSTVDDSSETIAEAQAILQQLGHLEKGAYKRGEHDRSTRGALRAFQIEHGLRPSGQLDFETMTQLPPHAAAAVVDSDGDGVPDDRDACPSTPRGAAVNARGCPLDADGDGVYDGLDKCPDSPRGAKVDSDGCPRDSDGDGVPDGLDKCPDTPRGTKVERDGCPAKAAELFEGAKKTLVLKGVNFETNSSTLTRDSLAVLDGVAQSLRDWPDVRVEVGGDIDSSGSEAHNLQLSAARATAVQDYIVSKGIKASRIVARGYGESRPTAGNDTAQGRAKNRRVELTRIG